MKALFYCVTNQHCLDTLIQLRYTATEKKILFAVVALFINADVVNEKFAIHTVFKALSPP